ncbi:hypothetical protein EVAR_17244_1 [Eumeta japonica]|uniref:Uncharacterized protein n=1 Tax=Eumeta variegata TaxID=151549 RepID=A0A4C1TSZ2_EUMVA|nr:hypothetical protein EVAR_17244_1 [Eumeta japonica]
MRSAGSRTPVVGERDIHDIYRNNTSVLHRYRGRKPIIRAELIALDEPLAAGRRGRSSYRDRYPLDERFDTSRFQSNHLPQGYVVVNVLIQNIKPVPSLRGIVSALRPRRDALCDETLQMIDIDVVGSTAVDTLSFRCGIIAYCGHKPLIH